MHMSGPNHEPSGQLIRTVTTDHLTPDKRELMNRSLSTCRKIDTAKEQSMIHTYVQHILRFLVFSPRRLLKATAHPVVNRCDGPLKMNSQILQNEPRIGDYQGCPIRWGSLLLMTQHIGNPGISNSSELFVTRDKSCSSSCLFHFAEISDKQFDLLSALKAEFDVFKIFTEDERSQKATEHDAKWSILILGPLTSHTTTVVQVFFGNLKDQGLQLLSNLILRTVTKSTSAVYLIIIIMDNMTSVLNTDASLPYNHDLSESLIVKKKNKDGRGVDLLLPYYNHSELVKTFSKSFCVTSPIVACSSISVLRSKFTTIVTIITTTIDGNTSVDADVSLLCSHGLFHHPKVLKATDENREPICVTASDVLTLTTFSPRAVVDFGTENFTNRPFVRYLLLENPHNEDQCVSIRRGLPPDEFMLAWIESEHTLPTQSDLSWKTPGYQLPTFSSSAPNSICVRGPHGRCLLRISWNPSQPQSSDNGGGGFYHIIQFRVNDAFPLQALVVGRLLPPVMERKTRLKRVCWLRRRYDRFHSSQTPLPTPSLIEQSQRGGLERSLSVQYFDEDSASFERPKHGVKAFFSHKTRSAALSLTLANDTDVGFVSPKLIRSPALKRDPQLTLKNEPSGTYYSGQAGCNLFYPYISYSLSELSERGLTQWLNSVFAPCIAANSDAISGEIPSGLGGRAYWVSLNNAVDMLHTPIMTGPGQRVEREVDEGKIVPMYDLSFRVDKGAKRRLMNQLTVNYSPIWLHLALDALTGAPVPKSAHISPTDGILKLSDPTRLAPPPVPLSQKLRIYLFTASSVSKHIATSVAAQSKKPTANPIPQKPAVNRDQLHNRHTIKRFLVLLWFLDRLKSNRLVEYNPCLFRFRSHVKSSAEMALLFARNFLTGENNLVRHLANLGVHLEVTQTPLDEYELTVSNLAVDLRDGIRLVKLAELLLPLMPNSKSRSGDYLAPATLMSLVRFPVISRLQKIHNVGLALKAFERHGRLCMADGTEIDPRDVVNGHREKSLALLWCLLLRYQVLSLVDVGLLNEEIERLRSMPTGDKVSDSSGGEETGTHSDDVVHMKLFLWASLVCRLYQVEVLNLDESFSDGRALCVLLHHYLPTLLPGGLIRHLTTSTASSYRLARHTPHLTRTSRYNLQLFQRKLSYLGDVPVLLEPSMMPDVDGLPGLLPPGLVLATLAYLSSRLISIGRQKLRDLVEDHAARILQTAWKKRRQVLQARNLRLLSCPKPTTSPRYAVLLFYFLFIFSLLLTCLNLVSNVEQEKCAAVVIQSCWRGFLARRQLFVERRAAVHIQTWWRSKIARQNWVALRRWVVDVQRVGRTHLAREHYSKLLVVAERRKLAAIRIQSFWRTCLFRRQLAAKRCAAVRIQALWRGILARRNYVSTYQLLINVQRVCRAHLARKRFSNRVVEAERRNRAAVLIQSCWRRLLARKQFAEQQNAAVYIQAWWRGQLAKQKWLAIRLWVIDLQRTGRRYLVRTQLSRRVLEAQQANRAAVRIQSCWRGFLERRQISKERNAAVRIQAWWRGQLVRRIWRETRQVVLWIQRKWRHILFRRHEAACLIQRCWRTHGLRRYLHRRRIAATVIQSCWKGILLRRQLAEIAGQRQAQKSALTKGKVGTAVIQRNNKLKPKCSKITFGLHLDSSEAHRLIRIRTQLFAATKIAFNSPDRRLCARARAAANCLIHSRSVTQVLQAIKELEIFTRLSSEICFWSVGVLSAGSNSSAKSQVPPHPADRSPLLHLLFLDVIQACNRSVPHEDILLRVTGTLLNIARHRRLAEHASLWWTPPSSQVDHETWISPALIARTRSRFSLSLSPTHRLPSTTDTEKQCLNSPSRPHRDHSDDRSVTSYSSVPLDSQTSVVEALIGILLRTWRARPGTLVSRFYYTYRINTPLFSVLEAPLVPADKLIRQILQTYGIQGRFAARTSNAQLPTSPPQIIGGRNCGSYNHCTTSTRFLTADDDDLDTVIFHGKDSENKYQDAEVQRSDIVQRSVHAVHWGIRLFARTACLLAMLCDAIPLNLLPTTSLLPVIRELSNCLARRGGGPQPRRLDAVEHTTSLLEQSAERMRHTMSNLRKQLSFPGYIHGFTWQAQNTNHNRVFSGFHLTGGCLRKLATRYSHVMRILHVGTDYNKVDVAVNCTTLRLLKWKIRDFVGYACKINKECEHTMLGTTIKGQIKGPPTKFLLANNATDERRYEFLSQSFVSSCQLYFFEMITAAHDVDKYTALVY
ncbi:abnormal spindle-like microcephaly-associated protein homolog [Clonorchis sinensis]|uniref:Abnormal spindle-like microcephaly-associated protein homolog n=1 Tax=Clonorchis sinensis TaxID=79923 RepID=G7YC53_CLOSI|nr:abnormal spindle-like microcephaly-associated protein homolog [Clonorchis sinensis]